MKHSSEQLKRESEYTRKNNDYMRKKRKGRRSERDDDYVEPARSKRDISSKKFCCFGVFLIVLLAIAIIYYFVSQIQDVVVKDYFEKKEQVQNIIPQGAEEVKTGVEQGENLIAETKESVENIQDKYNQAKETAEKVQQGYEDVVELKEKVEDFVK